MEQPSTLTPTTAPPRLAGRFPLYRVWQWAAYLAWALELLLFTDWRNAIGAPLVSAVLFYGASLLICVFALLAWLSRPPQPAWPAQPTVRRYNVALLALLAGSVALALVQGPIIAGNPILLSGSDVIPILQTYVTRFLAGEVVYKYIYFSYPLFPNHLPMQWLPYVVAQKAGIDYRWWAFMLFFVVGIGSYLWALMRWHTRWPEYVLKTLLPAGIMWWIIKYDFYIFGQTVEPTIIAYYCLLAAAVLSRSPWLQGLALTVCLTSRYSVVLWVPLYMIMLWFEAGKRHAITVALLTLVGIVVIYVWPFLSKDWSIFAHALREYKLSTIGEWERQSHMYTGIGLAGAFLKYAPGDLLDKIKLLQRVHLAVSGGVVLLCGVMYWRLRRRVDYRVLALLALKWYLATFYLLLQIPYTYLTSLVLFISPFVLIILPLTARRPPATPEPVPLAV